MITERKDTVLLASIIISESVVEKLNYFIDPQL